MKKQSQARAVSLGDPTAEQWDRDEAAVAHRLKQEEEQHYREVLARLEAEKARLDQQVEEFLNRHPEVSYASASLRIISPKKY